MAPFPAIRLKQPLRAFSKVSVEYGVPFHVEEEKEKIGNTTFLHVHYHVLCTSRWYRKKSCWTMVQILLVQTQNLKN